MTQLRANHKRAKIAVLRSGTDLAANRSGGARYQSMIIDTLRDRYDVEVFYMYYKEHMEENIGKRAIRFLKMAWTSRYKNFDANLCLLDRRTMFLFRRLPGVKYIGINHHYDTRKIHGAFTRSITAVTTLVGVPRVDVLVAVSKYWQSRFLEMGAKNVQVIYNAFDVDNISRTELGDFLNRYNIPMDRPIIYIGMDSEDKGAIDVYEALKDRGYLLITSGHKTTKINCLNLDLPYQDYLRLLSASTVAVTLSSMPEGWSRVAHEAMLVGTPVIGSGVAGMRELLQGGRQIICNKSSELPNIVADILTNPNQMRQLSIDGCEYARRFTIKKFKADWLDLVERTLSSSV